MMAAIKPKPHTPFALASIAIVLLAKTVFDVIVNDTVIDKRAIPIKRTPCVKVIAPYLV